MKIDFRETRWIELAQYRILRQDFIFKRISVAVVLLSQKITEKASWDEQIC